MLPEVLTFFLEVEAPEAEALRVEAQAEAETFEIVALPHHWFQGWPARYA
jgi:hypothetical protein